MIALFALAGANAVNSSRIDDTHNPVSVSFALWRPSAVPFALPRPL